MERWGTLWVVSGIMAISGAQLAHGKECAGVGFPDQVQVGGSALVLNGLGLRQATMLKVDVYVAALYTASASSDASAILASQTPVQLVLQFVRDVGADDLTTAWEEGFEANAKAQLPALAERLETLKSWMGDMRTGERLSFTHQPGAGVQVDVAGTAKGTIQGDDFARALLSIWLGAHPPNPGLKAGLLGGACD